MKRGQAHAGREFSFSQFNSRGTLVSYFSSDLARRYQSVGPSAWSGVEAGGQHALQQAGEATLIAAGLVPFGGGIALAGRELAAARTAQSQLTVIGHLPDYVKVAQARGANYLKPSADWNWQTQGQFIKDVIARGDDVLIGTPIRPGDSVLRHEIKQLVRAGYRPVEPGSSLLIKTGP